MNNQKGNILSIGLLFILIMTSSFSALFIRKLTAIRDQKAILNNFLCSKESNGELKKHKKSIGRYNLSIRSANIILTAATLSTRPEVFAAAKKWKKSSQYLQNIHHISFLNKIRTLYSKGCRFSPSVAKTHFMTKSGIKLSRNITGESIRRERRWEYYSIGTRNLLRTSFSKNKTLTEDTSF